MSEAAVLETEAATDPQLSTPPPDATPEVTPVGAGSETPETEPEARQPDSYNLTELDDLYKGGKLADPALVERRETLRQADNARRIEQQRVIAEYNAAEEQRATELAQAGTTARTSLRQAIEGELRAANERLREPDLDLIAERAERIIGDLEAKTKDIHLSPHERGLRNALLKIHGDSPQNRRALGAMELPDLANELYNAAYSLGQQAGPSADSKVTKTNEWHKDGYHSKSYQQGIDAMKAANPGWSLPSAATPVRAGAGGLPSREQWSSGTYEQRQDWKQQHGEDVADRIFA